VTRLRRNAAIVLALALSGAAASGQDAPVPVEEEPLHRTVLKNRYIQVFRIALPAGERTLMHIHARDDAAVRLSEATVTSQAAGQPMGAPETAHPGMVSARQNEPRPLTHLVQNVGTTTFHVMDVQILERPEGPLVPAIFEPAAENPQMRVYRYELAPGAVSDRHTHERPYLLIAATRADIQQVSPASSTVRRWSAGEFEWVEATVTHSLRNGGRDPAILIEFELK